MPDIDAYVTLEEFKNWKSSGGIVGSTYEFGDSSPPDPDEAMMVLALTSAARRIESICHRTFEVAGDTATERSFFSAHDGRYLFVDDFVGFAEATRDGSAIDFTVVPHDADRPATYLRGSFGSQREIKLSAKWGWPATPEPVRIVNLMLGLHLYERKLSPYGIQGGSELGFIRVAGADRDISEMLEGYVKLRARVGR